MPPAPFFYRYPSTDSPDRFASATDAARLKGKRSANTIGELAKKQGINVTDVKFIEKDLKLSSGVKAGKLQSAGN